MGRGDSDGAFERARREQQWGIVIIGFQGVCIIGSHFFSHRFVVARLIYSFPLHFDSRYERDVPGVRELY